MYSVGLTIFNIAYTLMTWTGLIAVEFFVNSALELVDTHISFILYLQCRPYTYMYMYSCMCGLIGDIGGPTVQYMLNKIVRTDFLNVDVHV